MEIGGINSYYTDYISKQAIDNSSSKIADPNKDYSQASDDELMDVCKQFESYFLEQIFKGMEKTVVKAEESSGSSSTLVDYFKENMIQELAAQSTETNSLGLAQMLYDQMKITYNL